MKDNGGGEDAYGKILFFILKIWESP